MNESLGHIFIDSLLINNFVLCVFLGMCPFLGLSSKFSTAWRMGVAVIFVITISSMLAYGTNQLLVAVHAEYLRLISYIVIIAATVQLTEMIIKKTSPALSRELGIYLPLITTNCAVLGIPLLNVREQHNFLESLFFGLGGAIGFTLVLVLFAAMRERLEAADVPKAFQGVSIAMITAGLMSLAFMGFAGLIR